MTGFRKPAIKASGEQHDPPAERDPEADERTLAEEEMVSLLMRLSLP